MWSIFDIPCKLNTVYPRTTDREWSCDCIILIPWSLEISYWWGCHCYCWCCCWHSQTFSFLWVARQRHGLRLQGNDGSDRRSFWLWFQWLLNHRRAGERVIMVIENSFFVLCGVILLCWCWLPAFELASNGCFWPIFWVCWSMFVHGGLSEEFRRSLMG